MAGWLVGVGVGVGLEGGGILGRSMIEAVFGWVGGGRVCLDGWMDGWMGDVGRLGGWALGAGLAGYDGDIDGASGYICFPVIFNCFVRVFFFFFTLLRFIRNVMEGGFDRVCMYGVREREGGRGGEGGDGWMVRVTDVAFGGLP